MNDKDIIELFFNRSEEAVERLSEKYGGLCLSVTMNILSSQRDAEECVNDTYYSVWETIPPNRPEKLSAYVCRIARNLALKKRKRENAEKRKGNYGECLEELDEVISGGTQPETILDEKLLKESINRFLGALDQTNRVLFVRRYWFSDSFQSLSALTGIKEQAIRTRLSRMRADLKNYLTKKGVLS